MQEQKPVSKLQQMRKNALKKKKIQNVPKKKITQCENKKQPTTNNQKQLISQKEPEQQKPNSDNKLIDVSIPTFVPSNILSAPQEIIIPPDESEKIEAINKQNNAQRQKKVQKQKISQQQIHKQNKDQQKKNEQAQRKKSIQNEARQNINKINQTKKDSIRIPNYIIPTVSIQQPNLNHQKNNQLQSVKIILKEAELIKQAVANLQSSIKGLEYIQKRIKVDKKFRARIKEKIHVLREIFNP